MIAATMLATAATGFCPNYIWLGISTYPRGCIALATASTPTRGEGGTRPERRIE